MPTDVEKKKKELEYEMIPEPSFLDRVKYFFARLFSTVVHFFKNIFLGPDVKEKPVSTSGNKMYITSKYNNNDYDKDDVVKEDITKENEEQNVTTETIIKNEENTNQPIVENNDIDESRLLNAENKTKSKDDTFVIDNDDDIVTVENNDIPIIPLDTIGENDDIFAEIEDADTHQQGDIIIDNTGDEILTDEVFDIKPLKDIFFETMRAVDSRAVAMEVNKDSLSIVFELEDESNILITLMQNGEIKDINRIDSSFDSIEDEMNLSSFKRKMTPITIGEIGFTGTADELKKLMQENPNIINEIYNSKNEIERRENKMVADAMQVKVDNFEDLKDILLGYLETANRNVITYDMQDKAILVKLPTRDTGDVNIMEMERDLVINLVDMSYNVKVEKMDFASRSGGYKTDYEDVDLNELGAKFVAIHEAIKANGDFFAKDLSTDGPVEDISYEEYVEDIFDDEENDKSRSSSRQRDKEKTMARNAAIKNKESSRSQRNDDDEEKKPQRKQHFRPNRDDDEYDL